MKNKIDYFLKPRFTWENINGNNGRNWKSLKSLITYWTLEMWARDEGISQSWALNQGKRKVGMRLRIQP